MTSGIFAGTVVTSVISMESGGCMDGGAGAYWPLFSKEHQETQGTLKEGNLQVIRFFQYLTCWRQRLGIRNSFCSSSAIG